MSRVVWWDPGMESLGPAVAALGVFDGVHLGHQALVRDAVGIARSRGVSSVVVTFDRDPDQVVTPASAAPQLLSLDDKLAELSRLEADVVLVMPFTPQLASTAPLAFLDEVLLGAMAPEAVVVGYDFRFGHRAEGDVDVLVRYGADRGFTVVAHELVRDADGPVTSTRIRAAIVDGEVRLAARLLGRPHRLHGEVVHGRGVGASLHAPTANIVTDAFAAVPGDGVYAGRARVAEGGVWHPAAISIGAPPSFPDATDLVEVHLIGHSGDLYGSTLTVEFRDRLRALRRFETRDELIEAIAADLRRVLDSVDG